MRIGLFLLGSFAGAPTRYLIDRFFRSYTKFPLGILIVNTSGAFLLGTVASLETSISFLLIGFCGALTTWSTFTLDLFEEFNSRNMREFILNLLSNYGIGVGAAILGIWVAQ